MAGHSPTYTKHVGQTDEYVGTPLGGSASTSIDAGSPLYDTHIEDIYSRIHGHFQWKLELGEHSASFVIVYQNTNFTEETYGESHPYGRILYPERGHSQPDDYSTAKTVIAFPDFEYLSESGRRGHLVFANSPTWPEWSEHTTELERTVLNRLFSQYREEAALRLNELIETIADNPDDDDVLLPDSLRYAANFLIVYQPPYSPYGTIVAGNDGVVSIEWRLPMTAPPDLRWKNCDGILSMRFLPSGKITFVGETREAGDEKPFFEIGEEPHNIAYRQVAPFVNKLRMLDDFQ